LEVICDQCGQLTSVDLKEKTHPNKIKENYFKCEHCFYHYTSYVTDARVRKLQRKRHEVKSVDVDKYRDIQEQIKERMTHLKHNLINFGRADL